MKRNACGIVVEYNPLHTGHIHHIRQSRITSQCDVLIAVMSPYTVQRGDIAILSPYHRAKEAIRQGVDLVVELPYPYCSEHADKFAYGAIRVLKELDIDTLCFGSETNSIQTLKEMMAENEHRILMKSQELSLARQNHTDASNDILGIAYLKALKDTGIQPLTIQRTNSYRSEIIEDTHASASALRKLFRTNPQDPSLHIYTPLAGLMAKESLPDLNQYYPIIHYCLLSMPITYLQSLFLMDEGIEGLFIKAARSCRTLDEFVEFCTSKRYTKARITRTLIHLLMQTTKTRALDLEHLEFVRILAMNENGQRYLSELKALRKDEKKRGTQAHRFPLASRFNQLPKLYQEEIIKQLSILYPDKQQFETAMKQELSYPILL